MSVTTRGVKNAFRNTIRSISITAILALTIALALVMLLSLKAVQARIDDVKASVGNTVTVMPAGARGFQGGGEPLTAETISKIEDTAHVKSVTSTLEDRWVTEGTDAPTGPNSETAGSTSLQSAIDPGTLGNRNNGNTDGALDDDDLQVAQALADNATNGILQARLIRDQTVLTGQLETALSSRVGIEQAKGVVAERNDIDVDAAFVLIRRFARNTNRLLSVTAAGIVDGTLTDEFLAQTAQRKPTR
jgi:hypothetical protein